LQLQLSDTPAARVKANFRKLVSVLKDKRLVITGKDLRQLERNQAAIYDKPYMVPKEGANGEHVNPAAFFYRYFRKHPTIFCSQIDVTSHCNFTCRHCYYPPDRSPVSLDTGLALDVLDQLSALGTLVVTFSGGEPLLHKDFAKIVQRARLADFIITMQSNASLVDERVVEYLAEANIATFHTSLYSMVPEDHDQITGVPGSLKKTLRGIELLQRASIPVLATCHVMKANRHSYMSVSEWSASQEVRCMTDFVMLARTDFDTANLKECLGMHATEQVVREMVGYENKEVEFGKSLRKYPIDVASFRSKPVCDVGTSTLCVAASGDCYPCSGFIGYKVGNVRDRSIAQIWNRSNKLKKLRNITWADFPECLKCDAFQFCSMCFGRNFNENHGDLLKPTEHQCDIARINMRVVKQAWRRPTKRSSQKESGGGFAHVGAIGPQGRETYQKLSAVFGPNPYPASNCGISILGAGAKSKPHKLLPDG
jgi:radical SAM protein with 4Fe4S-binding SPASM domain